jgi:hypothetical protein
MPTAARPIENFHRSDVGVTEAGSAGRWRMPRRGGKKVSERAVIREIRKAFAILWHE